MFKFGRTILTSVLYMDCLLVFGVIAFAVVSDQRGIFGVFVFALAVVIFPRCFCYSCVWYSKSVCVCVY